MRSTDRVGQDRLRVRLWLVIALAAAATLLAWASSQPALAASCGDEFTGASGGSWATPSNWSAGVPSAGTVVCWGAEKTVVVSEGSQAAASIAAGGGLLVEGAGRLALAGGPEASSLSGGVQAAEGGQLELGGDLECASVQISGGRVLDDGRIGCPVKVASGKLAGDGAIAAAVVNEAGTVEPGDGSAPGGLSVASYAQGEGAELSIREDRSTAASVSIHLLDVSGPSSLAGTVSLQPAAPPAGFPVIEAATEPSGFFSHVNAPSAGSPWTVAYGPGGAAAISGGTPPVKVAIAGSPQPGGTLTCGFASALQPRGMTAYRWLAPYPEVESVTPVVKSGLTVFPGTVEQQLSAELQNKQVPTVTVPGTAVGRRIGCEINVWTPAGGTASSVHTEGRSDPLAIGGPFRPTRTPVITGRPVPGSRLTCSRGSWEGAPSSYSYVWLSRRGPEGSIVYDVSGSSSYTVAPDLEGSLVCVVTAHYGAIAVPAEAFVDVPARPQPTLCPRRPVALVSVRRSARAVLLFGAAVQRDFGERVHAFRRAGRGRWRRVASGRVNGSGYFELSLPLSRGASARGSYRVEVGRTSSVALGLPGVLQIASDRSRPAESQVTLRLAEAGVLKVTRLDECRPSSTVATATLAAGGQLHVHLSGGSDPVAYLARARVGGRTYSTELVVPARPRPVELP